MVAWTKWMSRMSSDGSAQLSAALEKSRDEVNRRLGAIVEDEAGAPDDMRSALRYTLLDGGKRLRPVLCLWTHDGLGGEQRDACIDVACALECLHTYSLIHDDLPCMDDDDLRRGKASCHKKFGEAVAVLTGDALLTLCFDVIARLGERWGLEAGAIVETSRVVARAAGTEGLITGQALDLVSDTFEPTLEMVDRIHSHKTAALISASMLAGAVVAGADTAAKGRVERAGEMAGRAFQIIDDILDVQMDAETLGKTPGKDAKAGKLTYPSVVGLEAAKRRATELVEQARTELSDTVRGPLMGMLLNLIVTRSK
jgi:geranylgeranyl diphosphate synthase type II